MSDEIQPVGPWKGYLRYNINNDARELFVCRNGSEAAHQAGRYFAVGFQWEHVPLGKSGGDLRPLCGASWGDDGAAFLQAMLDVAWEAGLRPASFKDHTNELTAVRYHLEDMRKLALSPKP